MNTNSQHCDNKMSDHNGAM